MLSVLRGRRHAILPVCGNIEEYLIVRGNISRGSLSRGHIYRPIHYTPQKSVVSTPLLAESSILNAERIAWPAPRDSMTPQGVMSDHDARKKNVGGELLCEVF